MIRWLIDYQNNHSLQVYFGANQNKHYTCIPFVLWEPWKACKLEFCFLDGACGSQDTDMLPKHGHACSSVYTACSHMCSWGVWVINAGLRMCLQDVCADRAVLVSVIESSASHNFMMGKTRHCIQVCSVEGCWKQLCAHTCPPLQNGNHRIYFYVIWFLGRFCLTCLQVDLPINCLVSNYLPLSLKWARRPSVLPPPAWNIHTAVESDTGHVESGPAAGERWAKPKLCQDSLRAVWKSLQCVMFLYTVCVCVHVYLCVLAELLTVSCLFWLGSFFGLRHFWKLGSTLPAITKL